MKGILICGSIQKVDPALYPKIRGTKRRMPALICLYCYMLDAEAERATVYNIPVILLDRIFVCWSFCADAWCTSIFDIFLFLTPIAPGEPISDQIMCRVTIHRLQSTSMWNYLYLLYLNSLELLGSLSRNQRGIIINFLLLQSHINLITADLINSLDM